MEVTLRTRVKLLATTGAIAATYLGAIAPASQGATVCNEAENSHRGGYEVSGGTVDPVPPGLPAWLADAGRQRQVART